MRRKKLYCPGKRFVQGDRPTIFLRLFLNKERRKGGGGRLCFSPSCHGFESSLGWFISSQHRKTLLNHSTKQKQRTRSTNNISSTECLVLCKERGHYTLTAFVLLTDLPWVRIPGALLNQQTALFYLSAHKQELRKAFSNHSLDGSTGCFRLKTEPVAWWASIWWLELLTWSSIGNRQAL